MTLTQEFKLLIKISQCLQQFSVSLIRLGNPKLLKVSLKLDKNYWITPYTPDLD